MADKPKTPSGAARSVLAQKLAVSALPEAVQEKMRAQFAEGSFTEEEIEEAIRVEAATLEKLTASGALRGFGARAEVMRDEADRKKAALDGLWSSREEAVDGERPYRFMSEAFQDFTGHRLAPRQFFAETFHYHRAAEDWNGVRRLSASLQTSTWGEAFRGFDPPRHASRFQGRTLPPVEENRLLRDARQGFPHEPPCARRRLRRSANGRRAGRLSGAHLPDG